MVSASATNKANEAIPCQLNMECAAALERAAFDALADPRSGLAHSDEVE
jgi:hypothetical protein